MIRRSYVMSAAVLPLAFALAACGGGDDNATPSPSPTSSASPTPTASPSYATFPLSGAAEFVTITSFASYTGNLDTGPVTLGVAGVGPASQRVRVGYGTADPTAATTSLPYVIRENTEEARLSAGDLIVAPTPTVTEFVFRQTPTPTPTSTTSPTPTPTPVPGRYNEVAFLNNTVPSKFTSDSSLALSRVTYANWQRADSLTGATRITSAIYGYPTLLRDLPTTGSATYTARISGRIVRVATGSSGAGRNQKIGGALTVTSNWATGLVSVTINLVTIAADGTQTPFATYVGSGSTPVGTTEFNGPSTSGSQLAGSIQGSFFGSAGEQIGFTFASSGTFGGDDYTLSAAVVGKRSS
ncbi:hypothetical protein TPR58_19255 [Sphingomonas sp. HF-S3]|uniref:Transferrin-binding protein B C-lobe/N-lobe beta barrel domain-containing protein n=1 Tax=Sphingomonas rustica TaxID=3103142 RepID=A0ABV0BGV8_9SPHN